LFEHLRGEPTLRNLKNVPSVLKKIFVTTFDISPLDHLRSQTVFQEFTDNAVSKTINLPESSTIDDIKDIYLKAYELKLKGITVYRYGSKDEQVLYKESPPKEDTFIDGSYANSCLSRICQV
jgi:ribonucleoside-diphosphate reductase alpha chain